MPPEQWIAAFIAGLIIGVGIGVVLALYGFPWLAHQWNSIKMRRLQGRRHA